MIQKHSISWPQIISKDSNKIKETYGIGGYPTTFLLNPEGIIVEKNLRGIELEKKVTILINELSQQVTLLKIIVWFSPTWNPDWFR